MIDESIIEGCRNGDRRCQNSLVQTFAPRLMALCLRYCNDEEEAKDALQETFIAAFKYMYSYKNEGNFEAWIRKIAVRQCLAIIRKRDKFDFVEEKNLEWFGDAEIPDVYSKIGIDEILSLLNRLPKSLYLVFNLAVIEGLSHREVGEILNISESTSRAHLMRARLKMQELIHNHYQNNWKCEEIKTA